MAVKLKRLLLIEHCCVSVFVVGVTKCVFFFVCDPSAAFVGNYVWECILVKCKCLYIYIFWCAICFMFDRVKGYILEDVLYLLYFNFESQNIQNCFILWWDINA